MSLSSQPRPALRRQRGDQHHRLGRRPGLRLLASGKLYVRERQRVPALQARFESIQAELLQALERRELLASR